MRFFSFAPNRQYEDLFKKFLADKNLFIKIRLGRKQSIWFTFHGLINRQLLFFKTIALWHQIGLGTGTYSSTHTHIDSFQHSYISAATARAIHTHTHTRHDLLNFCGFKYYAGRHAAAFMQAIISVRIIFGMLKDFVHCVWSAAQIDPRRCHSRLKENEEDKNNKQTEKKNNKKY